MLFEERMNLFIFTFGTENVEPSFSSKYELFPALNVLSESVLEIKISSELKTFSLKGGFCEKVSSSQNFCPLKRKIIFLIVVNDSPGPGIISVKNAL